MNCGNCYGILCLLIITPFPSPPLLSLLSLSHSQSELSEQSKATSMGDESLFAMLDDDELVDHDELMASRSSDALLLDSKTDEDLILEMEEFI